MDTPKTPEIPISTFKRYLSCFHSLKCTWKGHPQKGIFNTPSLFRLFGPREEIQA